VQKPKYSLIAVLGLFAVYFGQGIFFKRYAWLAKWSKHAKIGMIILITVMLFKIIFKVLKIAHK
jgi:hypothetical protein